MRDPDGDKVKRVAEAMLLVENEVVIPGEAQDLPQHAADGGVAGRDLHHGVHVLVRAQRRAERAGDVECQRVEADRVDEV
jgi:hypothetical protein